MWKKAIMACYRSEKCLIGFFFMEKIMNSRIIFCVMVAVLSFLAGCHHQAELVLNFQTEDEVRYRVVTETGQDYEFDQPSINENAETHTRSRIGVAFAQKTESVDENGNAVATVTIDELKYHVSGSKGKTMDFDSSRAKDKSEALAKLIGLSYKIQITPSGEVKVLKAKAARGKVKSGFAGKVAKMLLSNAEIQKRHSVLALIDVNDGPYTEGDSWSSLAASPKGTLMSKSFEKIYTLTSINKQGGENIAVITMEAVPSSKRADGVPEDEKGFGALANVFGIEDTDTYNGELVLNLTTGQIVQYQEAFKAEWVAVQSPEEQTSDKGPDTLTMGFSHRYSIEMISE